MLRVRVLLLSAILCLPGCGTVLDLIEPGARVYGGVRVDGEFVRNVYVDRHGVAWWWWPLVLSAGLVDLPLSFALDTVLLPYTIPAVLLEEELPD